MVLATVDDIQADPQSLHHGRAGTAQVMRRPVAVLAVGKDQRIVMTPSGEGVAVFEPGLAIADLFTHHFYVHMPIIQLVGKAPLGISRQGLEFLKKMQGEGREEDMVVLFLAAGAFDVFTGEEPRLSLQIDIFPFGLQQLANSAQRAQADPERELGFFFQRPNAVVFLPGGEGAVIGGHLLEAVVQFQQLSRRKDAASFGFVVGWDQWGDVDQFCWIALD